MTIDSEITELGEIKKTPSTLRGKLSKYAAATLASILIPYGVLGVPNTAAHQENTQKPIISALHGSSEAHIATKIQPYIPDDSVVQSRNPDLEIKIRQIYASKILQSKDEKRMLQDAYIDFRKTKPGLSDIDVFYKFFEAYANHHSALPQLGIVAELRHHMYIQPVFKEKSLLRHAAFEDIMFNDDGTWRVVDFQLMPGFVDEHRRISEYLGNLMNSIPKTFIAPEVAGLQSPIVVRYWFLNDSYNHPKK